MNTVEIINGAFEGFSINKVKPFLKYPLGTVLKRKGRELTIRNNILISYHPSNRHIPSKEYLTEDVLNEINLHLLLEQMS